jgi:UDP-glucose 4-epimerase
VFQRLLVTGGCGLIGSSLVERALREGSHVVVLDNLSTGSLENLPRDPRVEVVVGEVGDDGLVGDLVRGCEAVAHLAAGVGVGLILSRPTGSLRQSLLGTEIVLRHAAAVRRPVFFASTSEVYGQGVDAPLREDGPAGFGPPDQLRFSYAAGKAAGEALAFAYAHEYSLPLVVGRFFNVTGPRQRAEHGAVIPRFVEQAVAGGPITVHGDGRQTRSFLDVRDAAEYVWRLLADAPLGGALFNIGRDDPITILDLAHRIRDLADPTAAIEHRPPDYGEGFVEIRHRRPDPTRLLDRTGFEPRHSLEQTLRACVYEAEDSRRTQST